MKVQFAGPRSRRLLRVAVGRAVQVDEIRVTKAARSKNERARSHVLNRRGVCDRFVSQFGEGGFIWMDSRMRVVPQTRFIVQCVENLLARLLRVLDPVRKL